MAELLPRVAAVELGRLVEVATDSLKAGREQDRVEAELGPHEHDGHGEQGDTRVRQPSDLDSIGERVSGSTTLTAWPPVAIPQLMNPTAALNICFQIEGHAR